MPRTRQIALEVMSVLHCWKVALRRTLPADVDAAVPDALDASRNTLEWLWDGLPPAERVVVSALAEAGPGPITQDGLEQLLHESGVRVVIRELQNAPRLLQEWDLIEPADGGYCFRVELLRRWLVERKPLSRVQEELDRIEPVAENLYQAASGLYRGGQLDQAVELLRQAVAINPNHVGATQLLADILLIQRQPGQARELLERLYEYQPAAARPRLTQALLAEARAAEEDGEQLALYERVLKLNPRQPEAATERKRIWQQRGDAAVEDDDLEAALKAYREADLAGKAAEIKQEIRRRNLTAAPAKKKAETRMPRPPSGLVIATPENLAQLLAQPEPPARVWWEQAEMELCLLEAGEFLMDSPEGQGGDDEHPQHAVCLDAYYMGRYPVTQAQYARFVREAGHQVPFVKAVGHQSPFVKVDLSKPYNWDQKRQTPPKGREDHPVVLVSWEDTAAYCKWAGLRLPTEAEWEKAASWVGATLRGRPQGQKRIYPWGDEWDAKRCNTREGGKGETTPVGAYSPPGDSLSGCADMAGNVWEWCSSLYKPYPYDPSDGRENLETLGGRVLRGGSWSDDRDRARSAYRARFNPVSRSVSLGFRCCVSPTSF